MSNLKRWSRLLKRGSSASESTNRKGVVVLDAIQEAIPVVEVPPEAEALNEFVLVVPDHTYRTKYSAIVTEFFKEHLSTDQFELYPFSTTRTSDFQIRFGNSIPFEVNKLYRLNPKDNKYISVDKFVRVTDMEKMNEAIFLFSDLGAESIIVNESMYNKVKDSDKLTFSSELPESVPIPTSNREFKVEHETKDSSSFKNTNSSSGKFSIPEFKPHVKHENDANWYYHNKMQPMQILELVPKILQRNQLEHEFAFSTKQEHDKLFNMQVELAKVIGVAKNAEHSELSEFEYKFKVILFDKEKLKKLKEYRRPGHAIVVENTRKSLSKLATMRAEHYNDRAHYREDIIFPSGDIVRHKKIK